MVLYECSSCSKQFTKKSNFDRHFKGKTNTCQQPIDLDSDIIPVNKTEELDVTPDSHVLIVECKELKQVHNSVSLLLQQNLVFEGVNKATLMSLKNMVDELVKLSEPENTLKMESINTSNDITDINSGTNSGSINANSGSINTSNTSNTVNGNGNLIGNQNVLSININPLGCESVAHTTLSDALNVFSSSKPSITIPKLYKCIYNNIENRNFTKDSVKEAYIKYISDDFSVDYMSENLFKKNLMKRSLEYQLLLLNQHKDVMDEDKIFNCMKNILRLQDNINQNSISKSEFGEMIEAVINKEVRDKSILERFTEFLKYINTNTDVHDSKLEEIASTLELQNNIVKEYDKAPLYLESAKKYKCIDPTVETLYAIIKELHDDDKSLYSYRMKAKHYIEKKKEEL